MHARVMLVHAKPRFNLQLSSISSYTIILYIHVSYVDIPYTTYISYMHVV